MERNSAKLGAAVATVQILAVALVALLSWEAHAATITVDKIKNGPVRAQANRQRVEPAQVVDIPLISSTATPAPTAIPVVSTQDNRPEPQPTLAHSTTINGLTTDQILLLPDNVRNNVVEIYLRGRSLGNNPRAFSKLGDSTIESPYFLSRFDEGPYDLGEYSHLQTTIDYFAGSFNRLSATVRLGFHSWSALDPLWADSQICPANESPLECEIRLHRPSLLIIRLGSNDASVPAIFERHMREIVAFSIEQGVIPILGTKADRFEGNGNEINRILYQIAAEFEIPLWDFDLVAETLPDRGLGGDGIHLTTFYAHDYRDPESLRRGHSLHNLSALAVLDRMVETLTPLVADRPTELSG